MLKARIVKLCKEEEEASKRIVQARRKAKFINDMNLLKEEKQMRKRKWLEELKIQEEKNRRVFKDRKDESKGMVENSQKAYRTINRNNYFQTKEEQKRQISIIRANALADLEVKQQKYVEGKIWKNRSKSVAAYRFNYQDDKNKTVFNEKVQNWE